MKDIKDIIKQIEAKKEKISKERDELREIYGDLKDTINFIDNGIEGMECGLSEIEHAIDTLSELI